MYKPIIINIYNCENQFMKNCKLTDIHEKIISPEDL